MENENINFAENNESTGFVPSEDVSVYTESVEQEAPVKVKEPFSPVKNPLLVALDEGLIELSDLTDEEKAIAEGRKYKDPAKQSKLSRLIEKMFGNMKKGESLPALIMSVVNGGLVFVWIILYAVCVLSRESMMTQAVNQMIMTGTQSYTVVFDSPLFPVLRGLLYVLPVVMVAWTAVILAANKKQKELCDTRIIVGAFVCDFIAGVIALVDVFAIRIIFG